MTTCNRIDEVRDYAFDEMDRGAVDSVRQHLAGCGSCALELDRLQLTTAALRILPDREIPQRIAFVSDKVFEPSPVARWFSAFWNSAARLGFAGACAIAAALIVFAYRPSTIRSQGPGVQNAAVSAEISRQVNDAVARAVAQVRAEDAETSARITQAALEASDRKHAREHRALMVAFEENLTVLQKRYGAATMLALSDAAARSGGEQ